MRKNKWVMASLYTKDNMRYGLKKSTFNPIKINSTDLFSEENWIEIHVHRADEHDPRAMAISPNNAGVLLDLACPVLPFYSLVIEQVDKKKINILVTHHWLVNTSNCLSSSISLVLSSLSEMRFKVFEEKLIKEENGKWDFLKLKKSKNPPVAYHQLISSFVVMQKCS